MLDEPTSSNNRPLTPKNLMTEEVQVDGAPAKHAEHWKAPEMVESTLKYTAVTSRKTFNNNNKREVLQRLKDVIHSMRTVIEGQTQASVEAVKWYLSLNMIFCKSTSPKSRRQDRSGCFVLLRDVQAHQHSRTRLPISHRI